MMNGELKVVCNRLYKGKVDVRNYTVHRALMSHMNVRVQCKDLKEDLVLTPHQLIKDLVAVSKEFESKHDGKKYRLFSYECR